MKGSLMIIGFFCLGVLLSRLGATFDFMLEGQFSMYVLYALMFCVGVSIGNDRAALRSIIQCNWRMLLVPLATIVGTLLGVSMISVFLSGRSLSDCLAVGSGFGYYSLSSIFITEYKGAALGTVALTSNIIREIVTLLAAPLLVRFFGPLSVISCGGATTMDTTLPVITRYSGKEYVVIAITHGILVDLSVPFLVTFFASM